MKTSVILILFFVSSTLFSQVNLVPNPSFEQYSSCPDNASGIGDDQVTRATGWSTYSETSDYFHVCATIWNIRVPNNQAGYQIAHTGDAYCGLITFYQVGPYREVIGRGLSSPLSIGQKYFVSFFTSFAGKPGSNRATDKIGLKFSGMPYSYSNPIAINNQAHLYTDSVISDTVNWVKISGSFIADSAYQYIALGNFFSDSNTDTLSVGSNAFTGYYFIDDVCVTTDSLYNETWTGINYQEVTSDGFSIYPNPFNETFSIFLGSAYDHEPVFIELFNYLGQKILEISYENGIEMKISPSIPPGAYIIRMSCSGKKRHSLLIKQY